MRALILMHHPDEGPGTIGDYLSAHEVELQTVRLYAGEALPPDPESFEAIVAMGGPMNVYEQNEFPWLEPEDRFLRQALAAEVPLVGICLGAQLIAKALDAPISKNPVEELGWLDVSLSPDAYGDPLMAGVEPVFGAFHWHGDTFATPQGGVRLAASADCANQAFRWRNAWGLQFHVEVTVDIVATWVADHANADEFLAGFAGPGKQMAAQGERMYDNFWQVIRQRSRR